MDDSKKLISWFIANKKILNLKIINYTWGQKFSNKIYDYNSEIIIDDKKYEGRGTSYSQEKALLKSLAECIERTLLPYNLLNTSNGVAIHHDYKSACVNAKNEAIERDSYFCHFLTGTPFSELNYLSPQFDEVIEHLAHHKIDLKFYHLKESDNKFIIACICFGEHSIRPFGLTFGLSCDTVLENSIEKSFFESIRSSYHFFDLTKISKAMSIAEFNLKNSHSEIDHIHLGYDIEYSHKIKNLFLNKKNEPHSNYENLNLIDEGHFLNLKIPDVFKDLNLHAVKYFNQKLQPLFFEKTDLNKLNLSRLVNFKSQFKINDLIQIPHFLG